MDPKDIEQITDAVAEKLKPHTENTPAPQSLDATRFVTFSQMLIGMFLSMMVMVGWVWSYTGNVQAQIELVKERTTKTEYQNQISIDDRKSLHDDLTLTKTFVNDSVTQINLKLQRMDSNLTTLLNRK